MNKKFLALSLALTLGASLDAIRWPWSSRVAPEDVMTMEAIPLKPRAEKKATSMPSSPLRRQAYIVDGSPQSRIREEDRMTSDSSARKKSETFYGKSRLSREARMAPAKSVLRLGSFADDIDGIKGAFSASQRRSPAHGASVRSPRSH
jgi:hypothetical protein